MAAICHATSTGRPSKSKSQTSHRFNTARRTMNIGIRQISSTESSTTGSPQSVATPRHTEVSKCLQESHFSFHLCQLYRRWGKKGPFLVEQLSVPFQGKPCQPGSHPSSKERKLQRPLYFSEAHIGYSVLGVLLAWAFSSNILCTAPSQFLQVQNGTHFLNHSFQNLFRSKQILVFYK